MIRPSYRKFRVSNEYRFYQPWAVEALERDNYRCRICKKETSNLLVHHIDESRKLGKDSMNNNIDNLITLCSPCHAKVHKWNKVHQEIVEMRESGLTFQQIADIKKLTRQRVHQLYKKTVSA